MRIGRSSTTGSSLAVRLIDASHHRIMPWKNGSGTTTEIAIDPPGSDLNGGFRWRLSVADVRNSGPFSAFPGYERTIMLVEGNGMDLTIGHDQQRRLDRRFEPFVFSGDSPATCRLVDGPIRDFNLMVDRSRLRSRTQVWQSISAPRPMDLTLADHILHCFDGAVDLSVGAGTWVRTLRANETVVFQRGSCGGESLQVAGVAGCPSTVAVIALMELSPGHSD